MPVTVLLENIETITGLGICLKTLRHDLWQGTIADSIPARFNLHQRAFCRAVKKYSSAKCIECDLRQIPQLAGQRPAPFVHRCHAGASEVIIPMNWGARLCALAYLGPFRETDQQPAELPLLTAARITEMLTVGLMLQRFFLYELEVGGQNSGLMPSRSQQIVNFIRRNLAKSITLTDLANELCVSTSRAGHLVKEETGETFSQLKLKIRLQEAQSLMSGSVMTLESIAYAVGFNDVRYFYQSFQKQTGQTPGQWRKMQNNQRGKLLV